jgi:hypothetical protein
MREKKKEKKGKDFNEDKLVPIIYQDIKQASKLSQDMQDK